MLFWIFLMGKETICHHILQASMFTNCNHKKSLQIFIQHLRDFF